MSARQASRICFVISSRPAGPYAFTGVFLPSTHDVKMKSGKPTVIGMKVGDEDRRELLGRQATDAFVAGRASSSDHTGADIDQVRRVVDDNRGGRSGALRIHARRAGAEQDDLCLTRCIDRRGFSDDGVRANDRD